MPARFVSASTAFSRLLSGLFILLLATLLSPAAAQTVFSAKASGPTGPTGLFRADQGTVVPVNTGLPYNEFAFVGRDGRTVTLSSSDPAQPNEPSTDLFLHDLVTGQTRKLHDNVTEPLPDGSYLFASPQFSRASDNGQRVAFVNLLASSNDQQQGGAYRQLLVLRGSDGFLLSSAEIGNGSMYDFYNSEFVGISWVPGSDQFVTPAYVDVVDNTGRPTAAAGLVMFARDSTGEYRRTGTLTQPQVFSDGLNVIVQTHAWPSFSPDGSLLAFFRMTYPSAVMDQPVETELLMIDASGSGWVMASFNPGVIGMGVSWSANGQQLVFSVAEQSYSNGLFPPTGEPHTAEVFTLDLSSNEFGRVPGVTSGFFPNGGGAAGGGGGETIFRSNFERQ
ncbi:MAG TPA: hypothetical protein VK064_02450 [Wenzhouxiangella sp.]|nr:hypothetical protein [Wenzhouxiangella sp.]